MLRSKRGQTSQDTLKRGISLIALVGLFAGTGSGLSRVNANEYLAHGLHNQALATFVEKLNATFFLIVAAGVPTALLLFLLYRLAPRSFRSVASVFALSALLLLVCQHPLFLAGWAAETPDHTTIGLLGGLLRFFIILLVIGIGRFIYEIFPSPGPVIRIVPFRLILATIFLLGAANSADYINRTKNFPRGPNVILITVDAMRPDHMTAFGYPRGTTPNLDRVASRGIIFNAAFTATPRTTQALSTIHTGRYSRSTGVRTLWDNLGPQEVTFAEVLRDEGYNTGGFVSLPSPDGESGFSQGFDTFVPVNSEAGTTIGHATTWLEGQKERPFFLWLHFSDPQMPYGKPRETRLFVDSDYDGPFEDQFEFKPTKGCVIFGLQQLDSTDARRAVDLYDNDLHYVDSSVGELIQFLERTERIHNSLIVVTATSGESLGENDYYFDHGELLYDPSLRIPIILSAANLPRRVIGNQVRSLDLLPTLLDVLHIEKTIGIQGRSLMAIVERPEEGGDLPVFAESGESLSPLFNNRRPINGVEGKRIAYRDGAWKLIVTPDRAGELIELYDLTADPAESLNVSTEFPEKVSSLRREMTGWLEKTPAPARPDEGSIPEWVFRTGRSD